MGHDHPAPGRRAATRGRRNDAPVVFNIAFNPRGGLLAAIGSDGLVQLWSPATGQQAGPPLPAGETGLFGAVAISPDGKRLAAGGATLSDPPVNDGTVRVWNMTAARPACAATASPAGRQG